MTDKEFLMWLYSRLLNVYHESHNTDFCKRLLEIVEKQDETRD